MSEAKKNLETKDKTICNAVLKKSLQSFIDEDHDPYLFVGDITKKKRKTEMNNTHGQKQIIYFFKKI